MKKREITSVLKGMGIGDVEYFSKFQLVSIRGTITRFKSNQDMHLHSFSVEKHDDETCKVTRNK